MRRSLGAGADAPAACPSPLPPPQRGGRDTASTGAVPRRDKRHKHTLLQKYRLLWRLQKPAERQEAGEVRAGQTLRSDRKAPIDEAALRARARVRVCARA